MLKEKSLILVVVVLLLFGAVGAYTVFNKNKNVNTQKLRVSSDFSELTDIDLLVDIATDKGYFRDNGVEVEKKNSNNNAVYLAAGESDLGIFPVPAILAGFYNKQDFRWLATVSNYLSSNYAVSRFSTADVNKINKVGVMKLGNAEQAVWPSILKALGHQTSDKLKFVAAPDSQIKMALLEKNEIDLSFIQSFNQMKEIKSKNKYTIMSPRDVFKDNTNMPVGIIAMNKTIQEKPDAIRGFTKAIYKANEYIRNNKSKVIATIKSKYSLSDEDAGTLYSDIVDSRNNLSFVPNPDSIALVSEFVKVKAKPAAPERSMDELIFKDYAQAAITK